MPTQRSQPPISAYRRTFVGRERELATLKGAFDAARAGQGGLVMVVGEPGIGKTAICEQLGAHVAAAGGRTLAGHCYEEGSLALPYLPFVEALRSYVLDRDAAALRQELGAGAPDVARIVPELRDRLQVEPSPPTTPEEDRFRLFQAVVAFFGSAAAEVPLCLVLEDLHDADKGTLDLLTHLGRDLAAAHLLVVGTYRDVEVDRAHPLSGALAELRRGPAFERIPLRGLTPDEVQRMLTNIAGQATPWPLAEAVHRQTEGNPLFIQEVFRYVAEEGLLVPEQGGWTVRTDILAERIPEGAAGRDRQAPVAPQRPLQPRARGGRGDRARVRPGDAGGGRRRVGGGTRRRAGGGGAHGGAGEARAGRRCTLPLHARLLPPDALRGVDRPPPPPAAPAGGPGAGDAVRRAARRPRRGVGRALRAFVGPRGPGQGRGLRGAGGPAGDAGLRARRGGAPPRWGARGAGGAGPPRHRPSLRDLLLALAAALLAAGEPERAGTEVLSEAFALAEALRDRRRAVAACEMATWAVPHPGTNPDYRMWVERLDRYADPDTNARVLADAHLASVAGLTGRVTEWGTVAARGYALAQRLAQRGVGDLDPFYISAGIFAGNRLLTGHGEEARAAAEAIAGSPRAVAIYESPTVAMCRYVWVCAIMQHLKAAMGASKW